MKKVFIIFMILVIASSGWMVSAQTLAGDGFKDVPKGDKYEQYIYKLRDLGITKGKGDGTFGYNQKITRAEFVALLVKVMHFDTKPLQKISLFKDIKTTDKNYAAVYYGVKNGIILQKEYKDGKFEPGKAITREETAVMIVRALQYQKLAVAIGNRASQFTDVTTNKGSIEMAYNMGFVKASSATLFKPKSNVMKQEAAEILVKLYNAVNNKMDMLNGFYAIKSSAQADRIKLFSSISYGWSRLDYDQETGSVVLQTKASNGGQPFYVPGDYQSATLEAEANNVKKYLMTFGTNEDKIDINGQKVGLVSALLNNDTSMQKLVQDLADKVNGLEGSGTGAAFDGVVVDFEGLRSGGSDSANFIKLLQQLKAQLDINQKQLLVCVNPKREPGQQYYDGYNYKEIGKVADYVILMAHDYEPKSLSAQEMQSFKGETPLAPIRDIYYALRYATDPQNGVPKDKLLLQVSFGAAQWQFKDGKLLNNRPYVPDYAKIVNRMQDNAVQNKKLVFSDDYKAPYISFDSEGIRNIIWYEDTRSISEKIRLARMFGIKGLSVWRLGQVPEFDKAGYKVDYMNIWPVLENLKK